MDYFLVGKSCFCPLCDIYVVAPLDLSLPEQQQWLKALIKHAGESHGSRHARRKYIRGLSEENLRYANLLRKLLNNHLDYLQEFNITKADVLAVSPGKLPFDLVKLLDQL